MWMKPQSMDNMPYYWAYIQSQIQVLSGILALSVFNMSILQHMN